MNDERTRKDYSWLAYLCALFAAGFSLPLSRAFIVTSLALLILRRLGRRDDAAACPAPKKKSIFSPTLAGLTIYFLVALSFSLAAAITNTDELLVPWKGLSKLDKLAWYLSIPLGAYHFKTPERMKTALKAFVLGCFATACFIILYNPAAAWFQVTVPHPRIPDSDLDSTQMALRRIVNFFGSTAINDVWKWINKSYRAMSFSGALAKLGLMADAQRLMTALPAALYLAFQTTKETKQHETFPCFSRLKHFRVVSWFSWSKRYFRITAPVVIFIALVITLKRGPLIFGIIGSVLLFIRNIGWKAVFIPLAAAVAVALIPAARDRFLALPGEFSLEKGGRATMWMQIAPQLRRERPFGIGFRALTNEKMRSIAPHVEARQVHLHSVPVQSWVDFGWAGLIAWALWMWLALRDAWRARTRAFGSLVPLAMLVALVGYGLMEYNIADGEIVLLYAFAMALASARISTDVPPLKHV